jgi:hypothetical protein
LISVACDVESEKKLRRRPPWQQPIYSDDIHRCCRYIAGVKTRSDGCFGTIVIERSLGGAMSQGAHTSRT